MASLFNFLVAASDILSAGIAITAFSLLLYSLTFNLRDRVARVFAALLLFVTIVSLLNHRKYIYAVPAILVMVALAPAMIVSGA